MSCNFSSRSVRFELLEQAEQLHRERNRVIDATISGLQQGKQRSSEVDHWLGEVEKALMEVEKLEERYGAPKSCGSLLQGASCVNFQSKMAVNMRQMLARIKSLTEERKHDSLPGLAPGKSHPFPSGKGVVGLESAVDEVWSFIADGQVRIIGIHGPGGVGKTTLLKQVYDALIDKIPDFDLIIWAQVPGRASLKTVRDAICEKLGLSDRLGGSDDVDNEVNEIRRASAIYNALWSKRFVIMLDDLWEPLELEKIGLPQAGHHQNQSKIIFATQIPEVCQRMKADKEYSLETLSEQDAKYLLQMVVGDDIFHENPNLFALRSEIIQECGHLPYAIVTVGRALRGRRREEDWKRVLEQLSSVSSPADVGKDKKYWFAPLKLSYESLSSRAMKKCFLYCSLLPEGYRIEKDQLVDYWIAEGFMGEVNGGMKDRRYEGYDIIDKLIDACLFGKEANFITTHQLVREMALMIASEDREEGLYFVKAGEELYEVPKIPEEAVKLSLMQSLVTKLPSSPPWPKVSTLLLSGNKFREIPDDFFKHMPSLQVLDLSNCAIEELPRTIRLLKELRYLNLSRTKLRTLGLDLYMLVKLEILYLNYIDGLNFVPSDLFAMFVNLQHLKMYRCGHQNWMFLDQTKKVDLLVGDREFLEELERLSKLENLEIGINGDSALEKFESSLKLRNCVSRVSIGGCKTPTISAIQFKNVRILEVSSCPNLLNFKIDRPGMEATASAGISEQTYFNSLQRVKIEYCWSLEELSWLCFAPNLQTLHVEECIKLKKVMASGGDQDAEAIAGTFFSLKKLYLRKLPSLTSISDFPLQFRLLEEISISYCPKLKKLPVNSSNANMALRMIKGEPQWFHELDDETKNSFSPYFLPI